MEILSALLEPKVLSILGPTGLLIALLVVAVIRLYARNVELQDRLLNQSLDAQRDHLSLIERINNTLETLIGVIRGTRHEK